jgi:hypothetical protein
MKTPRSVRPFFSVLALAIATGCASQLVGGDDSSTSPTPGGSSTPTAMPGGSPTPTPAALYGGYVSLGRIRIEVPNGSPSLSAYAQVAFYQPFAVAAGVPSQIDTCTVVQPGAPTPTPTAGPVSRDAGADVLLSGASSIDLARATNGSFLYYSPATAPLPLSSIAEGGTYDLSWPGAAGGVAAQTLTNAVTAPAALLITSPDLTHVVTLSGAIPVTWTGTSPDPAWISFSIVASGTSQITSAMCHVTDDGAFTIPANIVAQLPSGTGQFGMFRWRSSTAMLADGSTMYMNGVNEHFGQALKP